LPHRFLSRPSRRDALRMLGAGAATAWVSGNLAQAADLPIRTSGLEHIGMTVPDQRATAEFYGRIFDPQLFQERDPPPRFYVRTGISYIAFGGGTDLPPRIDHFCALVEDYKPQEMRKTLEDAGIPVSGRGALGMPTDPDGLRLQLLGAPGGLARTIIPSSRISQEEPAVQAIGFDHIVLAVTDLEKSAAFYRRFFGMEAARAKKPEHIWFAVAKTRLGLEPVASGSKPAIERVALRVAGFDRRAITEKLKKRSVEIVPSDDRDAVRFKDPNGITMELRSGA
jgi:catechol 2,3-dioxygenase-like lactoylglutathione lyase family enzyme